jgi:SNF2 family DNA or RNA helicase
MMIELYTYQKEIIKRAAQILILEGWLYLGLEMRLGKTLIALTLCEIIKAKKVLFVTKKKAISSIDSDYKKNGYGYGLEVVNYESLHRADVKNIEVMILDEAHVLGTFPKPNDKALLIRLLIEKSPNTKIIFLSGTPSPESYSQLFHQLWCVCRGPWKEYSSFYKWAGQIDKPNYVQIRTKMINGITIRDYNKADEARIKKEISKYMITMDQKTAGFDNYEITEEVIEIEGPSYLSSFETILTEERLYELKNKKGVILCDTAVKLMQKLHQLWSGTILTDQVVETGQKRTAIVLSEHKARYIATHYEGQKIAVYYLFRAEGEMLREILSERITEDAEQFNIQNDKIFISQIQSGSMGVNLSSADILIFYNISFSATHYFQARARTGSRDRVKKQVVHWLFTKDGIETKIYKAVAKKKDYTIKYFKKDYVREEVLTIKSKAC